MNTFLLNPKDFPAFYFEKYHKYSSPRKSTKNSPFTPSGWWHHCRDFPWNIEQLKVFDAICNTHGNYIVNSKAGGGKTTLLKAMLLFFPKDAKILIVAFNVHIKDAIANSGVLTKNKQTVSTTHGLGFSMLIKHRYGKAPKVDSSKVRKIITTEIDLLLSANQAAINKSIYAKYLSPDTLEHLLSFFDELKKPVARETKSLNIKALIDWQVEIIGACKKTLTNPSIETLESLVQTYRLDLSLIDIESNWKPLQKALEKAILLAIPDVLEKNNEIYERTGDIDYDDMIYLPNELDLPASDKTVLLVDECQDLNFAQIALIEKYHRLGARIIAVGDPRQSIYGFQYAVPDCWDELKKRFNLTEINMNYTYRCGKNIVKYIVDNGYHDNFIAHENNPDGNVKRIEQTGLVPMLKAGELVVSRMNAPLVRLCVSLYLHKKPAKIRGRGDLSLELINMLKPYCNTQEKWKNREGFEKWWSDSNRRINELFLDGQEVSAELLKDKVECICILMDDLGRKCSSFTIFEELVTDLFTDESDGGIVLSSIHRAKGDEADTVYVLGYPHLPYMNKATSDWEREQELNLVYVALTRPKNNLFLVNSSLFKLEKTEIEKIPM